MSRHYTMGTMAAPYADLMSTLKRDTLSRSKGAWGSILFSDTSKPPLELTSDEVTFGRKDACTVSFPGIAFISGVHCKLKRKSRSGTTRHDVFIQDLSTNGTHVVSQQKGRHRLVKARLSKLANGTEVVIVPGGPERKKISFTVCVFDESKEEAPTGDVTFVFTDVQSSTKLWASVTEAMDKGLKMHDAVLRRVLKECKGYEVKTEGDAFMVSFTSILDAVKWCTRSQAELMAVDWPAGLLTHPAASVEKDPDSQKEFFRGIRVRMGIHAGQPNCRVNPVTDRMDYFGPVVNECARISDSGHGGQIVCCQEVVDAIEASDEAWVKELKIKDLNKHTYKGVPNPIHIFEIVPSGLEGRTFGRLRTMSNESLEKSPAPAIPAHIRADLERSEPGSPATPTIPDDITSSVTMPFNQLCVDD